MVLRSKVTFCVVEMISGGLQFIKASAVAFFFAVCFATLLFFVWVIFRRLLKSLGPRRHLAFYTAIAILFCAPVVLLTASITLAAQGMGLTGLLDHIKPNSRVSRFFNAFSPAVQLSLFGGNAGVLWLWLGGVLMVASALVGFKLIVIGSTALSDGNWSSDDRVYLVAMFVAAPAALAGSSALCDWVLLSFGFSNDFRTYLAAITHVVGDAYGVALMCCILAAPCLRRHAMLATPPPAGRSIPSGGLCLAVCRVFDARTCEAAVGALAGSILTAKGMWLLGFFRWSPFLPYLPAFFTAFVAKAAPMQPWRAFGWSMLAAGACMFFSALVYGVQTLFRHFIVASSPNIVYRRRELLKAAQWMRLAAPVAWLAASCALCDWGLGLSLSHLRDGKPGPVDIWGIFQVAGGGYLMAVACLALFLPWLPSLAVGRWNMAPLARSATTGTA